MHINGIFFFGTASEVLSRLENLMDAKVVIIDCANIKFLDISAAFALEDMIIRLKDNDIKPLLVVNSKKLSRKLRSYGLSECISKDDIYFNLENAVNSINLQ